MVGHSGLRIITLGAFHFLYKDKNGMWVELIEKDLSARGPSITLVKFLLCNGPMMDSYMRPSSSTKQVWERHEASRDKVIDALWPEEGTAPLDADRAIAVAKSQLNRVLRPYAEGDVVVLTDGSDRIGYILNMDLFIIDADEFESCVAQASEAEGRGNYLQAIERWEAAYRLVQGEFLPHDLYNDWSKRRRERLYGKYRLALHRLAQLYAACGRTTEAVEKLHPYALAHPTELDAAMILLPLLAGQGRYEESMYLLESSRQAYNDEQKEFPAALEQLSRHLRQAQENALVSLSRLPLSLGSSGLAVPRETDTKGVIPSASSSLSHDRPFGEATTWFDLKHHLISVLVKQWYGRAMYSDLLQKIVDQELGMFNFVKTLYTFDAYTLSRRNALKAIAGLPLAFSSGGRLSYQKYQPSPEEFLPECAASISSCWHLLNGDGLSIIEETLPLYLPLLVKWARQSSRYQQIAAYLGAQGCLLMDLVSYHRFRFQDSLSYATQAVELAEVSGDRDLQVYALVLQGGAFNLNGYKRAMLEKHLRAEEIRDEVVPALRSYVLAELAYSHAENGQVQQALRCIGEARELFPSEFGEVPCYVTADYGLFQLIVFEGMTHLSLGEQDHIRKRDHNILACQALAQIEELPSGMLVPERLRVEIVNYQAQAAIAVGNLDDFEHYLLAGAQGARSLGSEKRHQEVLTNLSAARRLWPHEARVLQLADAVR